MSAYTKVHAAEQPTEMMIRGNNDTTSGDPDSLDSEKIPSIAESPRDSTISHQEVPEETFQDEVGEHMDLVGNPSGGGSDESHQPTNSNLPLHLQGQPRITWFDASMHLIKGNLGPGCLNLPHAFGLSGWLLGSGLFLLVAVQGIYSMMLLAECKQLLVATNRPVYTFMDVAQVSLGPKGHAFVQMFLFILQAGVCCVFLSLIATNMRAQTSLSQNASVAVVTCALLFVVLIRTMKDLRWLSTTANVFMLTAILTAAVSGISEVVQDDIPLPNKGTSDLGDVATFISSMFFSFEGIGLVLPVENTFTVSEFPDEIEEANHFYRTGILPGAMSVVGILFWIIGFFASWGFPDIENGSITAFLAEQFPDQPWFKAVNAMVMLAVFLTFPLQLTPALEVLEEWFTPAIALSSPTTTSEEIQPAADASSQETVPVIQPVDSTDGHREAALLADEDENLAPSTNSWWKKHQWIVPRYAIVFGCSIVVLLVDDLGLLMALFGAVGQTGLAMMPCLCHLSLQRHGIAPKHRFKTLLDLLIVIFATLVMFFGLVVSVNRIIQEKY